MPEPKTIAVWGLLIIGFILMIWGGIVIAISVDLPPFAMYYIPTPFGGATTENPQTFAGGLLFLLGLGCVIEAVKIAHSD